jgi:hypothetical protein
VFPNTFMPKKNNGMLMASVTSPMSHPFRWNRMVAMPLAPPPTIFAGA